MKTTLIILLLSVCTLSIARTEEPFVPRVAIDHKGYIDEALAHLLKERPDINPENLEVTGLSYHFQPAADTTVECGPDGCRILPAAPFFETLTVGFKILTSKHIVTKDGSDFIEYDGLSVQFPTPRIPRWFIGKSTISSKARTDKSKK